MKKVPLFSFTTFVVVLILFSSPLRADERPSDHQFGVRGGWINQRVEYGSQGKTEERDTGVLFGVNYTYLNYFDGTENMKWGLSGGLDKVKNDVYWSNIDGKIDYYSTRASFVIAYGLNQQVDIYGKVGVSYNHGDIGNIQINGVGFYDALGLSYQASTGAFSAIETQIDHFEDGKYKAPLSISLLVRAGFTF